MSFITFLKLNVGLRILIIILINSSSDIFSFKYLFNSNVIFSIDSFKSSTLSFEA